MQDTDLDDLFVKARADSPVPSATLLTRILADADAVQRSRATAAQSRKQGRWFGWTAALGGSGVFAGLASAGLAGLWLGIAQPSPVSALSQGISDAFTGDTGLAEVELIPAIDAFGAEG